MTATNVNISFTGKFNERLREVNTIYAKTHKKFIRRIELNALEEG